MNFGESKVKHNIIPNKALTTKNMETLKVIVPKSRTLITSATRLVDGIEDDMALTANDYQDFKKETIHIFP